MEDGLLRHHDGSVWHRDNGLMNVWQASGDGGCRIGNDDVGLASTVHGWNWLEVRRNNRLDINWS